MEIQFAADINIKELSVFEFLSEAKGLTIINSLPEETRVIDLFELQNGQFACLLTGQNMKSLHQKIKKTHKKYIRADAYISQLNSETLRSFYFLNKPEVQESLLIVELKNLAELTAALNSVYQNNCSALDVKSQRVFIKNILYVTGTLAACRKLQRVLRNRKIKSELITEISGSLLAFFGLSKPG